MNVAEWNWIPMGLQLGLLEYLRIPYTEYLCGRAVIETQTGDRFRGSSSTPSCSTFDPSASNVSAVAGRDWQISTIDSLSRRNRYGPFGFAKRRSESYKNLDLEDAIFIPHFCTDDQPGLPHTAAEFQQEERSSSQVHPQHSRQEALVLAPLVGDWHLGPQDNIIPASTYTINSRKLARPTTTPERTRSPSLKFPKRNTSSSDQSSPWWTPLASHAPITPPSTTVRWASTMLRRTDIVARKLMAEQERLNKQSSSAPSRVFIPSRLVQERNSPDSIGLYTLPPTPTRSAPDTNHYGRSDISADQNCAIYIVGIPAAAQYSDVLDSIRGGKILVCLIDPPDRQHHTAAAKIVFFTRASAELFMERSRGVGVYILGRRVRAMWNRIFYAAHTKTHQSRVILISGPAHLMDFEIFESFFRERFEYQEESRSEIPCNREGYALYMWKFASLRAQAELAYISIEREWHGIFKVEYGPDTCARLWV